MRRSAIRIALLATALLFCIECHARADNPTPSLALVVENTAYDNIFLPSEEKKVVIAIHNLTTQPKTTDLTMKGVTDDGHALTFKQSVSVPPSATIEIPVTLDLREPASPTAPSAGTTLRAPIPRSPLSGRRIWIRSLSKSLALVSATSPIR